MNTVEDFIATSIFYNVPDILREDVAYKNLRHFRQWKHNIKTHDFPLKILFCDDDKIYLSKNKFTFFLRSSFSLFTELKESSVWKPSDSYKEKCGVWQW